MSSTKPSDLTLALQKKTQGFTSTIVRPTDTNIIDIRKLLLPVLMNTKYEKLTLTHNILGIILPTKPYKHIYSNKNYLIPPFTALYDDTIDKDAMRTEVH